MTITVETVVRASLDSVWEAWTTPADIERWNAASDDWHTTRAEVDLRVGGRFTSRMEAKDGSAGFDFGGRYTVVEPPHRLAYIMDDGRRCEVRFEAVVAAGVEAVRVCETFETESTHPVELQRQGWQAILDRFAAHVEADVGGARS